METNGIISSNTNSQTDMPPWMICLHKKFSDQMVGFNIKLFLMRLITHTHTIFKPYARYWLTPIIKMCNQIFEKSSEGLNTFLIDTIVILLSWNSVAIPSEVDAISVQRLLEYLFLNCTHKNSLVMKSNLDLIKKLIESWKERIYAPTLIIYKLISDPDIKSKQNAIGLSLIGILLANHILPYNQINDLSEDKFNETLLKNMKNSFRNIYAAAAEVVGMLLNIKKLKGESNQRLLEQLSYILKWHTSQGIQDTYVTCIYSLQKHYSDIIDKTVMNKLMFGLKKLYGDFKMECLESMIPNIIEFDSAYLELKAAGILDILIHKDFSIRSVALRLLHKLLPKLIHEQLFEIAQILSIDGPNECQYWTLEIYKWMYDYITEYLTNEIKVSSISISETFYHHVREQLLEFLSSKNEYIRVNCRNFWCDPKRLSILSHHRLIALVDQLYSIKTENNYLNYSTNFLLERTTHNPDYNRFLFENPLDICIFQEFPLECNWRQRHHTYMTPLFTLQSSQSTILDSSNPIQFMETLSNNNNNIEQLQNPTTSMLLQTQEISNRQQFIPTQIIDNNINYNWLKQTNTFDTTNTFILPTLSIQTKKTTSLIVNVEKTILNSKDDDDIFRLKRRFLKDTGKLHGYFIKKQNEKKQKEKQFLTDIKLKQENQVEKYRTYRIGELPDIQIRSSDIIIPLQALSQYDNHIARLLYSTLFTSILTSLEDKLSEDEYFELIKTLQHRFDIILSQSEIFYPSFIAALLDIILFKSKQIKISAQYISASTIASHLESIGILTLECFIRLNDYNELLYGTIKKKFKSDSNLNKQIDYWLELAKCYRSIANYDDVRGIFYQIPGLKSLTLQAIEEESHSDFLSALNSYITALEQYPIIDETLNDPILELEHEFWTQSMLNCCNQLNNWIIMSKHIFIPNTTFDTLWSNAYQLNYLMPYAIRAKLKLLISGTEQEQLDQENLCQFFNNLSIITITNSETTFVKRSYIEKQYSFELATFFLYQKDFDRSKYYIQYAKEQFLLRWSQLSRLNEYGRKITIQLIQPYHELEQFLIFIEHNLPLIKTLENRYLTNNKNDIITRDLFFERIHKDLISQWQLPDVVRSSIQIWDDIITNRALFLDILDELIGGPRMTFTSHLKAIEFDPILVDYKIQSSLDMAYCALRQRNFKLALSKLNDTRNRIDLCQNSLLKSIYWNEIYCDVHLKRHQIQSSTSTLSSLLSTLVAKELKKMEIKINSLKIIDEQTASLNSTYIKLNSQFSRTVIDFLLAQPKAYFDYEHDEKISQAKHKQLEIYLYGLDTQTDNIQKADLLINELFNKSVNILKDNIEKQETDLQNLSVRKLLWNSHILHSKIESVSFK
jgi:DNA-dependent protein kinase catalytic subunit